MVWPNVGDADGTDGDLVMIAPPFVISEEQIDEIIPAVEDDARHVAEIRIIDAGSAARLVPFVSLFLLLPILDLVSERLRNAGGPPVFAVCVTKALSYELSRRVLETKKSHIQTRHFLGIVLDLLAELGKREVCEPAAEPAMGVAQIDAGMLERLKRV